MESRAALFKLADVSEEPIASVFYCDNRNTSQHGPVNINMAKVRTFEDYVMKLTTLAFRSLHWSKLGTYVENETS
jgi:hypothetical protein